MVWSGGAARHLYRFVCERLRLGPGRISRDRYRTVVLVSRGVRLGSEKSSRFPSHILLLGSLLYELRDGLRDV